MNNILALWHGEHAKFARLLGLLEQQLEAFRANAEPDFEVMADVVRYLREYGDAVHHPREDIGFRRLLEKQPDTGPMVQRLLQEHRALAVAGRELLERLERLQSDTMAPREPIESAAATYLLYYRHHLGKEEREIIPRIQSSFDEDDWKIVREGLKGIDDPLSTEADQRFRTLRRHLSQPPASRQ